MGRREVRTDCSVNPGSRDGYSGAPRGDLRTLRGGPMRRTKLRIGLLALVAACQVVDKTPGARSTPATPSDSVVSVAAAPSPAPPAPAPQLAPAATRVAAVVGFRPPKCVRHERTQE